MTLWRSMLAGLSVAGLMVAQTMPPSPDDAGLRKEVDQLKAQLKSMQGDLDQIKLLLREQSERAHPVFKISGYPSVGEKTAKLVVIEFSDFECPYCSEYVKTSYRQVIDAYVRTGKIRYVFGDFPAEKIHPNALKAAGAGRCAEEQSKFWEMHDQLFLHQRDLGTSGIQAAAAAAGLDVASFETCLAAGRYIANIRQAEEETAKLGLQGTPAFVFGMADPANPSMVKLTRALVGSQPFTAFQQTIDTLLAQ